jgi:hypothetical protein
MKSLRSVVIVAVAALLIAGVAAVAIFSGGSGDLTKGAFPHRIQSSLALPDSSLGIDQRLTSLAGDEFVAQLANIDFKNGETGEDLFRPNGTMKSREVFYKAVEGLPRQLKWRATIAEDGVTYMDDAAFWMDGSRQRVGTRNADGTYQIQTWFEGGVAEHESTVLAADGSALYHRVLRLDGTLAYVGENSKGTIEEKTFSDNGQPLKYVQRSMFRTHLIDYYPDTGVAKTDFLMETYLVTATYRDETGNITQKREFTFAGMKVVVYENGVPKYSQFWQRLNPFEAQKGGKPSVLQIYSVARLDAQGNEHWKLWFQSGTNFEGKPPVPMFSYESVDGLPIEESGHVKVSNYTDAGCLRVETWSDAQYGKELRRIEYPQDRGCSTLDLPLDLMKEIPFVAPPKTVPEPEPHHP